MDPSPRLDCGPRSGYPPAMSEVIFEVGREGDGGFVAECLTEGIFAQGDTWEELRENVREAVAAPAYGPCGKRFAFPTAPTGPTARKEKTHTPLKRTPLFSQIPRAQAFARTAP